MLCSSVAATLNRSIALSIKSSTTGFQPVLRHRQLTLKPMTQIDVYRKSKHRAWRRFSRSLPVAIPSGRRQDGLLGNGGTTKNAKAKPITNHRVRPNSPAVPAARSCPMTSSSLRSRCLLPTLLQMRRSLQPQLFFAVYQHCQACAPRSLRFLHEANCICNLPEP